MAFTAQHIFYLILMLVLLFGSALFSGAETILFSLSRHDRARMKKSANRLEALVASLLENPRALLTTLMTGNMTCNILIFVLSTLLLTGASDGHSATAAGGGAAGAADGGGAGGDFQRSFWSYLFPLLALVPPVAVTYFSDVLPKVLGSLNNTRLAPLIAIPVATLVRAFWIVTKVMDVAIMRPVHRLVGTRHHRPGFSTDELREMLEMSEQQGVIDVSENELLQEVVRLGELRVRDVMTPRVDVAAYNLKDPPERLLAILRDSHLTKLPVYDGQIDSIVGLIYAKEVLLEPSDRKLDVRKLLRPVQFVPEFQSLDRLIGRFRATRTQLAVAVDEYGGVVGVVALEDVVEQMVGDIYEPHDQPVSATEKVGPDEYRVAGDLSVVEWLEAFGAPAGGPTRSDLARISTVAGLLATLLKRVPRAGDQVRVGHLLMTVETMRGRRVERVRLKLIETDLSAVATSP